MAWHDELPRLRADYGTHEDLLDLFERICAGRPPRGWSRGRAFEFLVLRAFELEGAQVEYSFRVRSPHGSEALEEFDGLVSTHGLTVLCEFKDWSRKQPVDAIEKLVAKLLRRPPTAMGAVFSSSDYTKPALQLAEKYVGHTTVLLWYRSDIEFCLRERAFGRGLKAKYLHAVRTGLPDMILSKEQLLADHRG